MTGLMALLREANPAHPGEQPPDEDVLARILATPPEAPARRRPRRRLALALAAVAALAGIASVSLIGGPTSEGGVAKAQAAVTDADAIYHFVLQLDDEQGRRFEEAWFTGDQRRSRGLSYAARDGRRGEIVAENVTDGTRSRQWVAERNRIFELELPGTPGAYNPLADFREAIGPDTEVDEIEYRGRDAYRLTWVSGNELIRSVTIVDAETYLPMLIEDRDRYDTRGSGTYTALRYTTFEKLERTPETERLLEMSPHPGARTVKQP